MYDNVITFPLSTKATAGSSIAATAEAPTSSVVQFRPASRSRGDAIAALPKEEKQRSALDIMWRIGRGASHARALSLKEQRASRYEAWAKAGCETGLRKALNDFQLSLYVAQGEKMPEALLYDLVEPGSASWHASRKAYQEAIDRQLLAPAPNVGAVRWKQRQKFSSLPRDRIEKAIADDLAWLEKYPASERRVRRPAD
jgi:hypothetical protein